MARRIAAVSTRPELAPLVAQWRVDAFYDYPGGYTVQEMTALILEPPIGPEETFVLFERGQPVGTAALICTDLGTRQELPPCLAGLFVEPAFRGRGYATALIQRVETFALAAAVPVLWLYTTTAEALYARLGWQRVGTEKGGGEEQVLMKRALVKLHRRPNFTC